MAPTEGDVTEAPQDGAPKPGGANGARWGAGVAVVVALAVWFAFASGSGGSGEDGVAPVSADGGTLVVLPVDQRKEPVELSGDALDGKRVDLSTLRGKPVVINVWGSWCAPCRKEAPDLVAAANQLEGRAAFVGVAVRDEADTAKAFQRRFEVPYPSLLDEGDLLLGLRGAIASQSPPVTLVLDAQGRVAARFLGPVTTRTLVGMVEDVTTG